MVDFMSSAAFDAGGPQPSAAGGAAGGFGQLANVLAQGPRMHAQAAYLAAEADKARAETTGLTQSQGVLQGRADRAQEAMGLLSDPTLTRDPQRLAAVMQRVTAIGLADPTLAPNMNGLMQGLLSRAAMTNDVLRRQTDAANAATPGGPAYGNTATGAAQEQANQRTLEAQRQTGATGRTVIEQQGANYRDPQAVRPPNAPPGTPPVLTSLADVYAHPSTPVSAAQQAAEAAPTSVMGPNGPALMGTGAATAQQAEPILGGGPPQVQGVGIQQTVWPRPFGAGPVNLTPPAQGGDTSAPTPAPGPTAAAAPGNAQSPSTPSSLSGAFGTATAATPQPTAPQPTAPQPTPTAPQPTPAQRVGQASIEATGGNMPQPVTAEEAAKRQQYVQSLGATMYPAGSGVMGGLPGTLGPQAQAAIMRRAEELTATRNPRFLNNWSNSVTQAKEDLQANGQLPPDASQSADWGRTLKFQGKNVVELQPPGTYKPAASQGAQPSGGTGQQQQQPGGTSAVRAPDGSTWKQIGAKWFKLDAQGQPLGAAPGVTTAPARTTTTAAPVARPRPGLDTGFSPAAPGSPKTLAERTGDLGQFWKNALGRPRPPGQ